MVDKDVGFLNPRRVTAGSDAKKMVYLADHLATGAAGEADSSYF
jgi:hypothetical protein